MNILFMTLAKLTTSKESSIYMDLLNKFAKEGNNVYIATPIEKKATNLIKEGNINFLQINVGNMSNVSFIQKGVSTFFLGSKYYKEISRFYKDIKFDLILYSTPPITLYSAIKKLKKKFLCKTYLLLKDIFPQNAVDLCLFKEKGFIYKYFRSKEKKFYLLSDYIGCMSEKNIEYILAHNPEIDKEKVHISPNTIAPSSLSRITKIDKDEIRKKYGIPNDSTVYIYGGNLGKPQGIDFIIECIESCKMNSDAFFVICGKGTEYKKILEYKTASDNPNLLLINGLKKDKYDELVNCCDVGLVFLDYRFTIPNFPSRILSYMDKSMPVICCTDPNTDVGEVVENNNFGWKCYSNSCESFRNIIMNMKEENIILFGNNAREYLLKNYTNQISYDIISSKIKGE